MHRKQTLTLISSVAILACIGIVNAASVAPFSQYGQIQPVQKYSSNPFWNKDSPYNQRFPTPIYATGADLNTADCNRIVATLVSSYCASNNNCIGKRVSDIRPHIIKQLAELPGHSFATSCGGYIDSAVDSYQKTYGNMQPGKLTPKPTAFPTTISSTIATTVDNLLTPSASEYQRGVAERAAELKQLQAQTGATPTLTASNFPKTTADLPFTDRLKNIAAGFEPYKDKRAYQELNLESEDAFFTRLKGENEDEYCRQRPNSSECKEAREKRAKVKAQTQPTMAKCRHILDICDGSSLPHPAAFTALIDGVCREYINKKLQTRPDGTPIYDDDGVQLTDPSVELNAEFVSDYIINEMGTRRTELEADIKKLPPLTMSEISGDNQDPSIYISWAEVASKLHITLLLDTDEKCQCKDPTHMTPDCQCKNIGIYTTSKGADGMCECNNKMKISDGCKCSDESHMDKDCNCKKVGGVKTRNDGGTCVCENGGDINNNCQCSLTGDGVNPATCQCYDTNRMDPNCNCKNNGTFDPGTHTCTCPITDSDVMDQNTCTCLNNKTYNSSTRKCECPIADSNVMDQNTCQCLGNKHYDLSTGNCEDNGGGGTTPPLADNVDYYIVQCIVRNRYNIKSVGSSFLSKYTEAHAITDLDCARAQNLTRTLDHCFTPCNAGSELGYFNKILPDLSFCTAYSNGSSRTSTFNFFMSTDTKMEYGAFKGGHPLPFSSTDINKIETIVAENKEDIKNNCFDSDNRPWVLYFVTSSGDDKYTIKKLIYLSNE